MRYRRYQRFKLSPILVLVIVNLLLFLVIFIIGKIAPQLASKLVLTLGLPPPAYFWDQPWTIVTSMFVHIQFWHIFANMITLYFFGTYFFRLVGERKFLLVYFGGGILGNILLLLLAQFSPYNIAFGASGAIFALAGALVVMRPKLPVLIFPIPVPIPLWLAVIGGFLILTVLPIRFNWPIAWQAHLGGLVLGLIAGYFFRKRERYFSW